MDNNHIDHLLEEIGNDIPKVNHILSNKIYSKAIENKLGLLNITEYMSFMENGDRRTFENKYYERRNDCSYTSVAYIS